MIATQHSKPSAAAATFSAVPDDATTILLGSAEATAETRSTLRDVLSAWIFFLLLVAALGGATMILDLVR